MASSTRIGGGLHRELSARQVQMCANSPHFLPHSFNLLGLPKYSNTDMRFVPQDCYRWHDRHWSLPGVRQVPRGGWAREHADMLLARGRDRVCDPPSVGGDGDTVPRGWYVNSQTATAIHFRRPYSLLPLMHILVFFWGFPAGSPCTLLLRVPICILHES
jgi:hypothetical protein